MRIFTVTVALAALIAQVPAFSAELADCKLDQGNFPGKALRDFKVQNQARYFMEVDGALKNGTENVFERDEAILNVELKVVRTTLALTPSADVILKSSWALSPNFGFVKGRPYRVWEIAELPDGRKFGLINHRADSVLFFDDANQFCSKVVSSTQNGQVWQMGTLSADVPNPSFERSLIDDVLKAGSLRIIYLGTTAGALRIQEVWVQGSRIGKSVTRTFDQFAKSIDVAGYKFEVIEAKGDKLKLRYDVPSRTEITFAQVGQIALQNNRD
jgi:hypothetical protein